MWSGRAHCYQSIRRGDAIGSSAACLLLVARVPTHAVPSSVKSTFLAAHTLSRSTRQRRVAALQLRTPGKLRPSARLIALFIGALVAFGPAARAQYSFTLIADSTSATFGAISGTPSINSAGTVAFHAALDAGGSGIFSGNGNTLTTIVESGSPTFLAFGSSPSINSAGMVAFRAHLDAGGSGIFKGNGGSPITIADTSGPAFSGFGSTSINSAGIVAFFANRKPSGYGIFSGDGVALTTIAVSTVMQGGVDPAFSSFGENPSINSANTVAFFATANYQGIYRGDGGSPTIIADGSGPFLYFGVAAAAINSVGNASFMASLDAGGQGIFRSENGTLTTIAYSDSSGFGQFGNTSINSAGTVGYFAALEGGGYGIFTGDGGPTSRVIGQGDVLNGSTVAHVSLGNGALNDLGQISFRYTLADGISGVAVATPIPEPVSLILVAGGAALLLAGRRRAHILPIRGL